MFFICRVVALVLYVARFYDHGVWGSDYFAISLYAHINEEKAKELADKMFPEERKEN